MYVRIDESEIRPIYDRVNAELARNPRWANNPNMAARWLTQSKSFLSRYRLAGALYGFSFLRDNTVAAVLEMVARTTNLSLAQVYKIGEDEQWIAPDSRTFTPHPHKDNPYYPRPEYNSCRGPARRPPYVPMIVTEASVPSDVLVVPPANAPLPAYLKDDDVFPAESINIPRYNTCIKTLRATEVAVIQRLAEDLRTGCFYGSQLSDDLPTLLAEMYDGCFLAMPSHVLPFILKEEPEPYRPNGNWPMFLTRVHKWMIQAWPPDLLHESPFVSRVAYPKLRILAAANNPPLQRWLESINVDQYSFSDLDDLFEFFGQGARYAS